MSNGSENIIKAAGAAGLELRQGARLSEYTSFKIGGPAELMLFPKSEGELRLALSLCRESGMPVFFLGNGSNLLAPDEGYRGAVIATAGLLGMRREGERLWCAAGERLKALCEFAAESSLTGLEFAYGIPGSAGGAAFMNAGAYGGEMKDVLTACSYITRDGEPGELRGEELELGYRHSAFAENGGFIVELELKLTVGDKAEIRERMNDFMRRRRDKQPLEYPSAGSVFKRPQGDFAGRLIDVCGLRGFAIGGAQVSEKHCGFIVNRGGATCAEVLALVEHIRKTVLEREGVELEPEVRVMG
ncbi:MAG: UDP-N-acetylmuramate dehydrogenase [Clostridium sp.]|jgi:UDP-N-acetylmuramate dehydrogenase|nr:UDP-N-acetylmuramate dehydrogenase [Clostridium sp.]